MKALSLENLLWAAGFICNAALLLVLLARKRYRVLPWFTAWIGFGTLFTTTLFLCSRVGTNHAYAVCYWIGAVLDLILQVTVVIEMGRIVLRRSGQWVEGAKGRFTTMAITGVAIAAGLSFSVKPFAASSFDVWTVRGNLFTAILICFLFTAVVAASQQFGLGWRTLVMREGYGLTVWALTGFLVDTLHGYFGTHWHFNTLDHLNMAVYLGSLLYWSVALWLPEQQAQILPAISDKINPYTQLGKRLDYAQSGKVSSRDAAVPK